MLSSAHPALPISVSASPRVAEGVQHLLKESVLENLVVLVPRDVELILIGIVILQARITARDTARDTIRDTVQYTVRYTVHDTVRDTARDMTRHTARDTVRDTARYTARDRARDIGGEGKMKGREHGGGS